jgi:hypothetical protein
MSNAVSPLGIVKMNAYAKLRLESKDVKNYIVSVIRGVHPNFLQ